MTPRRLWPWLGWLVGMAAVALAVLWALHNVYQLPLQPDAFRFLRPKLGWLLPLALLPLLLHGWRGDGTAARWQYSDTGQLAPVHAGLRVLGLSVITDMCLPDHLEVATVEKILGVARSAEPKLRAIITAAVRNAG